MMVFDRTYLIAKEHKERQSEGDNEEKENRQKLQEGPEDIRKHDNEDAEARNLPNEQHQFQPSEQNGHGSELPLPNLWRKQKWNRHN